MLYAFDYDGTLDDKTVQQLAIKLKRNGNEIYVVTMRRDDDFNYKIMKPTLDKLGISKGCVVFCNEQPKWKFLQAINADVYIDNISDEFQIIKDQTNTIPLLWFQY